VKPPRLVQRAGSSVAHYARPNTQVAFCYQPIPGHGAWPPPEPGVALCRHCDRRAQAAG
jgi:hypothetical protein